MKKINIIFICTLFFLIIYSCTSFDDAKEISGTLVFNEVGTHSFSINADNIDATITLFGANNEEIQRVKGLLMSKTSKDGRVVFYEDTHSYFLDDKTKLTSITKYVSKFKAPFDSDKIATAYAKKHGLIKEDVLKDWKDKGEKSCESGTFVHSVFEDYINEKPLITNDKYPKSKVALLVIDEL